MSTTKRKASGEKGSESEAESESENSSYAPSAINVDFDFQAPTTIDFQAVKRLIQQLFYTHSPDLDLTSLSQHVLDMATTRSVGTVIKVEGDEDMDPFAFISAVELAQPTSSAAGRELSKYLQDRLASSSSASGKSITQLLSSQSSKPLLVLHERMINLPPATAPPLYRMLLDEIKADKDLDTSTHLLFFSRVFSSDAFSDEDGEEGDGPQDQPRSTKDGGKGKKRRKEVKGGIRNEAITKMTEVGHEAEEMGLFHPEDSILAKYGLHSFTYRFPSPKDAAKDFEAPMFGRIVVVDRDEKKLQSFMEEMQTSFEGTAPMLD